MTEEFKAMCQTVAEMAKEELDVGQGGCFLMFAHDDGEDENTVTTVYGKPVSLCVALSMLMATLTKDMTAVERGAFILAAMGAAMKKCAEDKAEERP